MFLMSTWEDRAKRAAAPHAEKVKKARLTLIRLDEFDLEAIAEEGNRDIG